MTDLADSDLPVPRATSSAESSKEWHRPNERDWVTYGEIIRSGGPRKSFQACCAPGMSCGARESGTVGISAVIVRGSSKTNRPFIGRWSTKQWRFVSLPGVAPSNMGNGHDQITSGRFHPIYVITTRQRLFFTGRVGSCRLPIPDRSPTNAEALVQQLSGGTWLCCQATLWAF